MAPADSKDWLFAAVALTTAMTSAPMASASDQAGVVTGVLSSTQASSDQTNQVSLVLGDVVRVGASFRTGPEGVIHILFLDQSSITVGPDSVLTVEQFTHDPQTRTGQIGLMLGSGSVRVVGGLNSKANPTRIRTNDATVEILGGITMVQSTPSQTTASFLFGQQMRVSGTDGNTQSVVRPGFSVSTNNGGPRAPVRLLSQQLTQYNSQFEANPSTTGTASTAATSTPTPTPTAPLIATSDRGANQPASSPSAIANDRLSSSTSTLVGSTMSNTRSDSIATSERQTLATTVRTQTVQASS